MSRRSEFLKNKNKLKQEYAEIQNGTRKSFSMNFSPALLYRTLKSKWKPSRRQTAEGQLKRLYEVIGKYLPTEARTEIEKLRHDSERLFKEFMRQQEEDLNNEFASYLEQEIGIIEKYKKQLNLIDPGKA